MTVKTALTGQQAETNAFNFLKKKGLSLIEKNYRCKAGEIDLIMEDAHTLIFVEVRHRSNPQFGSGLESVDTRKQRKIITTAQHYLTYKNKTKKRDCRFDVVATSHHPSTADLIWIKAAFDGSGHPTL